MAKGYSDLNAEEKNVVLQSMLDDLKKEYGEMVGELVKTVCSQVERIEQAIEKSSTEQHILSMKLSVCEWKLRGYDGKLIKSLEIELNEFTEKYLTGGK